MTVQERINALSSLGEHLRLLQPIEIDDICQKVSSQNNWFSFENTKEAINGISYLLVQLSSFNLEKKYYKISKDFTSITIGIIGAGNIPGVCMHDVFSVLLSGHNVKIKLSSDDAVLPKLIAEKLFKIAPELKNKISFSDNLKNINALIATGSNNSARYFDYYFSQIPRIIRKNRTSIAILKGTENKEELKKLGHDIFSYFGKGCRNVSKLLVPQNYDFSVLFESLFQYGEVINNSKYANNYEYYRAIYLMNGDSFLDNNFLLLKKSKELFSPIGVLYFDEYESMDEVLDFINLNKENLQCVVSDSLSNSGVKFGQTQRPTFLDFADGIDTLDFLQNIS
jgi:hypothetical protein